MDGVRGRRLRSSRGAPPPSATIGDRPQPAWLGPQASADFASPDNNRARDSGLSCDSRIPSNYYLVYRQTGGSKRSPVSRVIDGVETVLKQKNISNPFRGVSFRLGARVEGQLLTLLLNDLPLLTVSDGTFAEGTLGLLLASKGPLSLPADEFRAAVE